MRNTKLWSVLLAAVLLCACVVGVLFVGTQAQGTAYAWYVDGVGTAENSYATIDAAMAAAKAKTDWAAEDTLTIYVTASGTTSTFNTAQTGGQVNTGRNLFNVITVFRADNTQLPITIDGDNPATADAVEQNTLLITEPVWSLGGKLSFSATNDYTFKNLDLSSWGNSAYAFYAGAGEVTFNNVNFGSTQSMVITPSVGGWTPFINWTPAQLEANKAKDGSGLVETAFIFLNTNYGKTNGTLSCRSANVGIADKGSATGGGLTVLTNMFRNKIVIGTGSTAAYVNHHSVNSINTLGAAPAESVIEVDGGTITSLLSVRGAYTGVGHKLVSNIKSGSVTTHRMGPNDAAGKFTGNIEVNWTGGTVSEFRGAYKGTIDGDVTINLKGVTCSWNDLTVVGSTVTGTLAQTIEDCTINGQFYLGANAKNVVNTLKGTINVADNFSYFGSNSAAITGDVTNNIAADIVYTGTSEMSNRGLFGGSNGGNVTGTVTNNILPGADLTDYPFSAGCNGGSAAAVVNNMSGGIVGEFRATHGINNGTELASVKSTITGGTIDLFIGATSNAGIKVNKVENFIGKVNEDGTFAGDAWIKKFYGGALSKSTVVGEIVNTFYAGTIGAENREDGTTWATDSTNFVAFGGSSLGTVNKITNNFHGGEFNVGYFYCGNATSSASFNTEYALNEGEYRITNNLYGGHFARFCGGSKAGDALSVANLIQGTSHGSLTVRQGAFYASLGANANTDVYNEITSYGPVDLQDAKGNYTADLSKNNVTFFGGNNNQNVQTKSITNVVKNGVKITTFYGGCNSGLQPKEITNHIYDAKITTFMGGNKTNNYSAEMTGITNIIDAGEIGTYYGGFGTINVGVKLGYIENTINGGKIGTYLGGHHTTTDSNNKGEIVTLTNTMKGGQVTGNFIAGCYNSSTPADAATDGVYEIGAIVNNIGSDSIETRPTIGGNFFGGCYDVPSAANKTTGVVGYYNIGSITNTFDHAFINNNSYLGTRYNTLQDVTNYINNLEIDGSLVLANNVGNFNGTATTTIQNLTLRTGSVVADVNSGSCVVGENAAFILNIAEGAKITLDKDSTFNLKGNFPAKGTHTINAAAFELMQLDYWVDGKTYLTAPEGTISANLINIVDTVPGMAVVSNDKVVGASSLTAKSANLILTERVAIRIVYDKAVAAEYAADQIFALVNGAYAKVEIDPNNENAIIIYDIGLVDFDKEISFGGYLPALGADRDSIVELSDYAVTVVANNTIYKAIADFSRAYAGLDLQYGLSYTEVTKTSQMNAEPDFSALHITGKNLVMKDALGFRFYATLVGETAIEDIKVFIDGDDYTDFCNIAFVGDSTTDLTIDMYLGIKSMNAPINVKITAGETTAIDYIDYGDAIAQKIITAQPENGLAKAALVYIQAATQM